MRLELKFAILAEGKTQRQVAADTGLSENRLSEIVRGWATPRDDEKAALSRVLNQPVAVLFDGGERLAREQRDAGPADDTKEPALTPAAR